MSDFSVIPDGDAEFINARDAMLYAAEFCMLNLDCHFGDMGLPKFLVEVSCCRKPRPDCQKVSSTVYMDVAEQQDCMV